MHKFHTLNNSVMMPPVENNYVQSQKVINMKMQQKDGQTQKQVALRQSNVTKETSYPPANGLQPQPSTTELSNSTRSETENSKCDFKQPPPPLPPPIEQTARVQMQARSTRTTWNSKSELVSPIDLSRKRKCTNAPILLHNMKDKTPHKRRNHQNYTHRSMVKQYQTRMNTRQKIMQ
jgi:hypothetical protein